MAYQVEYTKCQARLLTGKQRLTRLPSSCQARATTNEQWRYATNQQRLFFRNTERLLGQLKTANLVALFVNVRVKPKTHCDKNLTRTQVLRQMAKRELSENPSHMRICTGYCYTNLLRHAPCTRSCQLPITVTAQMSNCNIGLMRTTENVL